MVDSFCAYSTRFVLIGKSAELSLRYTTPFVTLSPMNNNTRYNQAKKATIVSAAINTLLGFMKIIVGFLGHSQALVADGVHSFSDLLSDALVLFAAKAGNKSPDADHPYGHRRIETLGSIIIALLLITVGLALIGNTIRLIWHHEHLPLPNLSVLLIAIVSVGANEWLYRYMLKIANTIQSSLLRSNAWHNRGDAFTSVLVFMSVLGQLLGIPYLDAIGAILISLVIINIGGRMAWQGIRELIDTAVNPEELKKMDATIRKVSGVVDVHQLRTRFLGGNIYVDVHVLVDPMISVSEGHYISDQVFLALQQQHPNVTDTTVHVDPEDDEVAQPSIYLPDRSAIMQWLDTNCADLPGYREHMGIRLHYFNGKILLDLTITKKIKHHDKLQHTYDEVITKHTNIAKVFLYFR